MSRDRSVEERLPNHGASHSSRFVDLPPMEAPRPTAPRMPEGYGVPKDGSGGEKLPWSWAVEQLTAARNYWVCSTRRDGPPHAAPVWGLWLDGAVWFSTDRASRKARNLLENPAAIVHLESGDHVVILEGEAELVQEESELAAFVEAYDAKYGYRVDVSNPAFSVFRLRPRVARTWTEQAFPGTATRWVF
jgi:general stress protein 26